MILAGAALLAVAATSCGEAPSKADVTHLDTDDVTHLETDEVVSLSSELASCVEDSLGVEVAQDFLLEPEAQSFDLSQATPEQEQAMVECFSQVQGAPAANPTQEGNQPYGEQ